MGKVFPYIAVPAISNGTDLVSELKPSPYPRRLLRLTVAGPIGSKVQVYVVSVSPSNLIDQTSRGQSNTADYTNPIEVPPNMSMFVVWPAIAGAASATFFMDGN